MQYIFSFGIVNVKKLSKVEQKFSATQIKILSPQDPPERGFFFPWEINTVCVMTHESTSQVMTLTNLHFLFAPCPMDHTMDGPL